MAQITLVIFCLLQAADVWLTLRLLKRGGSEANPVMRYLIAEHGTAGLVVPKLVFCGLLWAFQPPNWLMLALVGLYALVCVSNWQELKGKRSLLDRIRGR